MDLELNEVTNQNELAGIEDALAALDDHVEVMPDVIEEITEETVEVAEAVEAIDETLDDDFLADLEMESAKQSVYESQAAETMPDIADTIDGKTSIKTKKVRATSKGVSTPRVASDLSAVPAEFFDVFTDSNLTTPADLEAAKTGLIAKRPTQVKVAEKFDNLFMKIAAGKKPSTYVMLAYNLLKSAGKFTSTELVNHYKANSLGDGTARSQAGQIMVLFEVAGIGSRSGQEMTARANSKIAQRLDALTAAPETE